MVDPAKIALVGYRLGGTIAVEPVERADCGEHRGARSVPQLRRRGRQEHHQGPMLILHRAEDQTAPLAELDNSSPRSARRQGRL